LALPFDPLCDAAVAATGAHPSVAGAESEFDRLIRIGN
jgi:hypothetical protein